MDAGDLHAAIAKVSPVASVLIGNADDRATWTWTPGPDATQEQIAAGNNVIATLEPNVEPVPPVISDYQFFLQLAIDGEITQQEALDAVKTGAIPARLETAVASLPTAQQFPARMAVSGATNFHRDNPKTKLLQQLMGWTDERADDLWRKASKL